MLAGFILLMVLISECCRISFVVDKQRFPHQRVVIHAKEKKRGEEELEEKKEVGEEEEPRQLSIEKSCNPSPLLPLLRAKKCNVIISRRAGAIV